MPVQDQRQGKVQERRLLLLPAGLAFCLMCLSIGGALPLAEARASAGYVVVYRDAAVDRHGSAAEMTNRLGDALGFRTAYRYRHAVKGFAARLTTAQAGELRADPDVALVTPNRTLRLMQTAPSATGVSRISAGAQQSGPSSVAVAVIDTGVDLRHSDLNAEHGVDCVRGGQATDDNGHGTHVAGIIGAKDDGVGVAGVAPGTRLVAVKSLDSSGAADLFQALCGIDWVAANARSRNIAVANLSFGGPGPASTCATDVLHRAICNATSAGVLFTAATNNSGTDIGGSTPDVPAWYPQVLAVSAMSDTDGQAGGAGVRSTCGPFEPDDSYATFTGFARAQADAAHMIAAPGVCITSTFPGGYRTESGTSMAAPHAAGVAAACFGQRGAAGPCSGLSPAAVIQKLRSDAAAASTPANGFVGDPARPVLDRYYGHLVSLAESTRPVPPPAAPATTSAVKPKLGFSLSGTRRRQKLRRLHVSVTLNQPASLTVTGKVGRWRLKQVTTSPAAGSPVRVRLRLEASLRRRALRMLRRDRRLTARLRVVVKAPDGARVARRISVKLS